MLWKGQPQLRLAIDTAGPVPEDCLMPTGLREGCDEGYVEVVAQGTLDASDGLYLFEYRESVSLSGGVNLTVCVPDTAYIISEVESRLEPIARPQGFNPTAPLLLLVFVAQIVILALMLKQKRGR